MVDMLGKIVREEFKTHLQEMRDWDPHDLITPNTWFPTRDAALGFMLIHLFSLIEKKKNVI